MNLPLTLMQTSETTDIYEMSDYEITVIYEDSVCFESMTKCPASVSSD